MTLRTVLSQAIHYHQEGRLTAADNLYSKILKINPNHPDALHLSGLIAHQSGKHPTAADLIRRAIEIDPNQAVFYCNLGNVMVSLGNSMEAIMSFQKAIALNPELVEAQYNLGNVFVKENKLEKAISCFRRTVDLKPDFPEAHHNLGIVLCKMNKFDEAIACLLDALRQKPNFPDAYRTLADVLKDQNRPVQAIGFYEKAIALKPDYVEAYVNKGNVFSEQGRLREAADSYQHALRINSASMDAYANLGKVLVDQGKLLEALDCYDKGLALDPDNGELIFDRSTLLLLMGNLAEGWEGYERRLDRPGWKKTYPHRFEIPRWDGLSFEGKTLLVHCEQGFGDILQFARYLPMVKANGGNIVFEAPKPLLKLFKAFPGVDALVEGPSMDKPGAGCDYFIPLLSLPGLFGTTLSSIPARIPYIHADLEKVEHWRKNIFGDKIKVGLVWEGKTTDAKRSCPIESFGGLAEIQGVQWYGLQKGRAADRVADLPGEMGLVNFGEAFEDFSDTAGAIENLDLVITIDTAVAHLAGGMGKPVWVLLKFSPDWRWLMTREDSPWYPTMRLFRQPRPGDWGGVMQNMLEALEVFVKS